MQDIRRLHRLVCLSEADIDTLATHSGLLQAILAERREEYEAWFRETSAWSDGDPPFLPTYLESFIAGEYGRDFFRIQYRQALYWRNHDCEHATSISALSQMRSLFVDQLMAQGGQEVARSLCRVIDLAQAIQALVTHLVISLQRYQEVVDKELARIHHSCETLLMVDRDQVLKAYTDHLEWKSRVYRLALGEPVARELLPLSENACDLGRWLDAGGLEQVPEKEREGLRSAHRRLHRLTRLAFEDADAGRPYGILDYLADIEAASDEIVDIFGQVLYQRLRRIATQDLLTGLGNRRAFDQRLRQDLAYAGRARVPLGLLMIDLDHFKQVNDAHGHAVGDEVLRAFAQRLEEAVRTADSVFRWGGEEFAVVVFPKDKAALEQVAARIHECVSCREVETSDGPLRITLSIGGTFLDAGTEIDAEALFSLADSLLMEAKAEGRDRVVISRATGP